MLQNDAANGGFPEPPAGAPVRVVVARHPACGTQTRVRLPGSVPARAIRRLHCAGCDQDYETGLIRDIGIEGAAPAEAGTAPPPVEVPAPVAEPVPAVTEPAAAGEPALAGRAAGEAIVAAAAAAAAPEAPRRRGLALPRLPLPRFNPRSRGWRLASIPIAAGAVIAGLVLIQSGEETSAPTGPVAEQAPATPAVPSATPAPDAEAPGAGPGSQVSRQAKLVRGSSYSLALPPGWDRIDPQGGATFAALAPGGDADVTLWISRDPELDFPAFISQSLAQVESLTGSARVVERVPGPTPESTLVRIAAGTPAEEPSYEVVLRIAGPYRYYLALSVQPDASTEAIEGSALVTDSFTPEVGGEG